ncbi:Zinc finger BED domain-containing protein RICESLEEPER 1 [Bienertia sinuspersici]
MDVEYSPEPIDLDLESGDDLNSTPSSKLTEKKKLHKPSHIAINRCKRQRRLTSGVWVNFEFLDEPDKHGNLLCKCKKCGTIYNADIKMGTGNLIRHLRNCKRRDIRDVGQMLLDSSSGKLENRLPEFNADCFREMLAVAIVRHDLPFQFVEYDGIRKCLTYLNPAVKVISRNTIKADILKMYKREKEKIKEELTMVSGRIALTSDCWTSITTDGYISLTAHFVDNRWCLQKRILNFHFIPPPHTGVHLSDQVFTMLKEWGIQKKVLSITLDNAASNDVFADLLKSELDLLCDGEYFHVRCCAHILNLIVQDGLKEIDDAVVKVRESVKYCKGSQSRRQRFLNCVAHVELESTKGLRQDVPTRWNSTYLMLESVLYYKKAFVHFQKMDANYVHCPTTEEWVRIENFFRFLKVFYEATLAFSGSNYPTSNLYFPNVLKVRLLLKEEMNSHDKFMQKMVVKMNEKFGKYWSRFSSIMAVAVVLDPRFKIQFVEWGFKKVYGDVKGEYEFLKFKDKLEALYNAYYAQSSLSLSTSSEKNRHTTNDHVGSSFDVTSDLFMTDFDSYSSIQSSGSIKTELQMYLEESLIPRSTNINILSHWRNHELRYPVLAEMAKDILAIPISTVASESAFSTGGRVLDCFRSSLKPSTVEAILCLRDWTFGEGNNFFYSLSYLLKLYFSISSNSEK